MIFSTDILNLPALSLFDSTIGKSYKVWNWIEWIKDWRIVISMVLTYNIYHLGNIT